MKTFVLSEKEELTDLHQSIQKEKRYTKMFWIWKHYKRNDFKYYFVCKYFSICFSSVRGSVFNRDMQSELTCPMCSEMLFFSIS